MSDKKVTVDLKTLNNLALVVGGVKDSVEQGKEVEAYRRLIQAEALIVELWQSREE